MLMKSLLLTPALLACAFGQGTTGPAVLTRSFEFPPVGLASSETAQVNVINTAIASTAAGATAPSCAGTITFANSSGVAVGTPVAFTTTGSQIFSTELSFSKLATSGTRAEFVAGVQLNLTAASKEPCSLVFSLETFDSSTGATHVFQANAVSPAAVPLLFGGH